MNHYHTSTIRLGDISRCSLAAEFSNARGFFCPVQTGRITKQCLAIDDGVFPKALCDYR